MNKTNKKKISDVIVQYIAAVLFVALIIFTFVMIFSFGNSSFTNDNVPFDLGRLTAKKESAFSDLNTESYLIPEFLGLTIKGEKYGISASSNIVSELYGMITPALSQLISEENLKKTDSTAWADYTEEERFIYVRYHSQLTDNVIGIFADSGNKNQERGNENKRNTVSAYVYEMFLIPPDDYMKTTRLAVRAVNGDVAVFESGSVDIRYDDISEAAESYKSSMCMFCFSDEKFQSSLDTEPIFLGAIATREIIITRKTATMIHDSDSDIELLMRLFSLNPDKLLSEHETQDGSKIYTDIHGVLYMTEDAFEYRATSDGGVDIEKIIGYAEKIGLEEYILASVEIISEIRSINKNFTGSEADIALHSVKSESGRVTISFEYLFDNVRITGGETAFTADFENGKLKSARLCTIAVRNLLSRYNSYSEAWFFKSMESGIIPQNVCLVYESDYLSESVSAKWAAFVPRDE